MSCIDGGAEARAGERVAGGTQHDFTNHAASGGRAGDTRIEFGLFAPQHGAAGLWAAGRQELGDLRERQAGLLAEEHDADAVDVVG